MVGAGQAGVSLSYYLQKQGIDHIVIERDQPFSSWRNRWRDFRANTPNWMNTLPFDGFQSNPFGDPNGFATKDDLVAYFDRCLATVNPPVAAGQEVSHARQEEDGTWLVKTAGELYRAGALAVCSGAMSSQSLPAKAVRVPAKTPQFHSSQYRSPDQVRTGSVLVVGGASSGVQICRLLCETGRFDQIHLAQSKVLVLPRTILGIPAHRFIHRMGLFNLRAHTVLGRLMYAGLETRGDPIMRPAPADLHREHGVILHPKFKDCNDGSIVFADGSELATEDLTIIWCTGFRPDYEFIDVPDRAKAFTPSGHPINNRGVVDAVPGLFFVGLRYQHTVASHDIYGVANDAHYIAGTIERHLSEAEQCVPESRNHLLVRRRT